MSNTPTPDLVVTYLSPGTVPPSFTYVEISLWRSGLVTFRGKDPANPPGTGDGQPYPSFAPDRKDLPEGSRGAGHLYFNHDSEPVTERELLCWWFGFTSGVFGSKSERRPEPVSEPVSEPEDEGPPPWVVPIKTKHR